MSPDIANASSPGLIEAGGKVTDSFGSITDLFISNAQGLMGFIWNILMFIINILVAIVSIPLTALYWLLLFFYHLPILVVWAESCICTMAFFNARNDPEHRGRLNYALMFTLLIAYNKTFFTLLIQGIVALIKYAVWLILKIYELIIKTIFSIIEAIPFVQ